MESFELQDELAALAHDVHAYTIPNERDFSSEDPARFLEAAVEAVANNTDAIRDPEVFDVFRSVLKHSASVPGTLMNKVLDSLTSGIQGEIDATIRDIEAGEQAIDSSHRIPLELFGFLLQWFITTAEHIKGDDGAPAAPAPKARRGRGGKAAGARAAKAAAAARMEETWSLQAHLPNTLAVISKVLIKLGMYWQKVWQTTTERETFVSCLVKPAYHVLENEQYMKVEQIRLGAEKVICVSVKHHNQILVAHTNIIQNLQFYEHLPDILAECLHILASEFAHTQLGDDILREIASKSFNAQDNKGPRNFARFLVKFAEYAPRSLLKQISLLLNQLDSEAYPMRIAIVEVIGYIIQELARSLESDINSAQTQKQINGLFDLLHERMLDVSSYVRTKVLAVLSKIFDIKSPKFPKQRLASTRAAVAALEDKASTVRKAAVSLLIKLLLTHPYGMYGGTLQHEVWNNEYNAIRKELDKVEGKVGKAVEVQNENENEDEGDGNEGEGHEEKKTKRSHKRRNNDENAMDVDNDGAETEDDNDQVTDEDEDDSMSVDSEGNPRKKAKKSKLKPRKSQLNMEALSQEQAAVAALEADDILRLRLKKKYYAEGLSFIRLIENSMELLVQLLGSTNKAEVLETMEFFRIAHGYELEGTKAGIQKMLHLIWVKDNSALTSEDGKELKGIRQRLIEVYCSLYFEADPNLGSDAKGQINRITKNMIERTFDCTLAEITSLEEMMRIMVEEDRVHPDVIAKLWQIYGSNRHIPPVQRRAAIMVLGMMAIAKKSILEDHVELMLKVGLGKLGRLDLDLARYTCIALQRLNGSAKKVKGSLKDNTVRYPMTSQIFSALNKAVERPCRSLDWFGLAEHVVNTVYALGQHPDEWCGHLIKKLAARAFGPRENREEPMNKEREDSSGENDGGDDDDDDEGEKKKEGVDEDGDVSMTQADMSFTQPSQTQNAGGEKRTADNFEMSQLFFVVGHVALKQIVYLELVEREWKRQKDETRANDGQSNKDGEELDQVAGNAEDEIGDRIQAIREVEILYGEQSLLAAYAQMIVRVCGSPQIFKDPVLRRTAIISFSKLLCVSSKFCEDHIGLLFKLLEKSKDSTVRGNIAIALGDIAVSFASIVDENSSQMYKGLSDGIIQVKKNTLMVLTHLILNGMVKVKGQLGEMAKCLEDEDTRIQDLSKLFFKELSGKENAIYNNLPDVISHLSTGEHAVSEEIFQNTLRYIFTFIDKERQAENIVEKLCGRFRFTDDPRQWRDIAFCLSLLPFKSERSVKRLIEGLQFYRDKLYEPVVFDKFTEILNKARSNKSKDKPDTELDEFEKILEEHRNQGQENQEFENMVEKRKVAARKKATKKASSRRKRQVMPAEVDDDD